MSEQIEPVREKIIDILRENGVKRTSFFGSIVRGEMTEDSDVDLRWNLRADGAFWIWPISRMSWRMQ